MTDNKKYLNKYRNESARAQWHDYNGGTYFITICTDHHDNHYFGEIMYSIGTMHRVPIYEPQMVLSEIGKYADEQIRITPQIRPDMNLEIPLYVVMPNHVHLIIVIGDNLYNAGCCCMDTMHRVHTTTTGNTFAPQRKNLASVIRGIKSSVTQYARVNNIPFAWQSRFHDRIIRDQYELFRIAEYIENNVTKWALDKNINENNQIDNHGKI